MDYPFTTKKCWAELMTRLELAEHDDVFQALISAYSEPKRAYHNLQHLNECLEKLERSKHYVEPVNADLIELALWFHDAIYALKAKDNEQRSADWACTFLSKAGASSKTSTTVHALIMATLHQETPSHLDAQLLVDIDLAILGETSQRFNQYEQQVRQEYSWVPWFLYKQKRKQVLKHFLNKANIYTTPIFRQKYEDKARANLKAALTALN